MRNDDSWGEIHFPSTSTKLVGRLSSFQNINMRPAISLCVAATKRDKVHQHVSKSTFFASAFFSSLHFVVRRRRCMNFERASCWSAQDIPFRCPAGYETKVNIEMVKLQLLLVLMASTREWQIWTLTDKSASCGCVCVFGRESIFSNLRCTGTMRCASEFEFESISGIRTMNRMLFFCSQSCRVMSCGVFVAHWPR